MTGWFVPGALFDLGPIVEGWCLFPATGACSLGCSLVGVIG
jgi:hypothetical protein